MLRVMRVAATSVRKPASGVHMPGTRMPRMPRSDLKNSALTCSRVEKGKTVTSIHPEGLHQDSVNQKKHEEVIDPISQFGSVSLWGSQPNIKVQKLFVEKEQVYSLEDNTDESSAVLGAMQKALENRRVQLTLEIYEDPEKDWNQPIFIYSSNLSANLHKRKFNIQAAHDLHNTQGPNWYKLTLDDSRGHFLPVAH